MPTTPPNLGYGKPTEATIDQVNIWMRSTPWYQEQMRQWGQDPGHPNLSKSQSQQILKQAQANGVVVDEGNMEVDDHGNFNPQGHKLRNTLIVAGIAGATIATMGAAGMFAGAGSAGAAGAAGTASTVAGVEGGAYGLGATAVGALGTGAMGAVPVAGTLGAAGTAAAGTLGSTVGVGGFDAAGNFIGPSTISSVAPAGGGGFLSSAGHFLTTPGGSALAGTFGNVFSNIYGANKQASANEDAARLADAATRRAEQFSREQAEGGWQSSEHTQKANYDQWRARQNAIMDSLGTQLGIHYTPPEYSPGIDPRYTGGAASPTGAPSPSGPSSTAPSGIDWNAPAPQLAASLSAFYKSKGVSDQEVPYWVSKAPELVARGKEINNPNYANERLAASDVFGGGNGAAAPAAPKPLAPTFARPNFVPVPTPYQPGTLGAYVGSY